MQLAITQQPQALRDLIAFYQQGEGLARLAGLRGRAAPILTGMGASLHAAQAILPYFHSLEIPAIAAEATDLVYYSRALLAERRPLIVVSQSGASAEAAALVSQLPGDTTLIAITNNQQSPLARGAQLVLPILAGSESGLATKTYVNSLATLWLLARHWAGRTSGDETATLSRIAEACAQLLADGDTLAEQWSDALGSAETIVFLGHGPHAATARQATMMLAERARYAAVGASVGAFRHGPIEIAQPGVGVVLFGARGRTGESSRALAAELRGYGARVLLVEHGRARDIDDPGDADPLYDEFLAPILDIIPAQLFAEALAARRGIEPAFRYIGKVVTRL